jgi:hypothetical protein
MLPQEELCKKALGMMQNKLVPPKIRVFHRVLCLLFSNKFAMDNEYYVMEKAVHFGADPRF